MNANTKALTAATLAVSAALILLGLGFDIYETNKFSDCVDTSINIGRCVSANRGGLIVFVIGLIGIIGAGAAWLTLRRSVPSEGRNP
ncbi:hypothetical protein QM716_10455 [Rhodococcus sp. IEGM 1409]|uniref:hypothetical protein n=1 Tax=Rhodococcus sp. IEGM 1409 TaxID=3047082 RepID=UPI0024B7F56F|nr:hypothetical protein [Rhodococcus sp. IEGM 1409]MDI9900276.1 hypothetical protein [Rhodococcus sp. IEGM 1409]